MTEGSTSTFSKASETGGSSPRHLIKVLPIGGSDSGCDPVKPSTCPSAKIMIGGSERVESLTGPDESSNQAPAKTMAPPTRHESDDCLSTVPENAANMRPRPRDQGQHEQEAPSPDDCDDCGGSRRRSATPAPALLQRSGSLPSSQIQRSPSIAEAGSHRRGRFSTGMIDVGAVREGGAATKRVSFGRLSVRKYPIVLGDHPDCSCGPPVTIDWKYREFSPVDVDDYETRRPVRKNEREMILPYLKRREILTRISGHTEVEIKEATREVARVQKQRKQTVKTLQFQRVEEAVQTTMRGLRKLRPGSGSGSSKASYPGKLGASAEAKRKDVSSRRNCKCPGMDGGTSAMDSRNHLRERHRDSLCKARSKTQH